MIFSPFRRRGGKSGDDDPAAESMDFLTGDPLVDRRSLQLLLDTMIEVGSSEDFDELLENLVDKSIEVTRGERGFLLLRREGSDEPADVEVRVARTSEGKPVPISEGYSTTVLRHVLETREPVERVVQSGKEALDLGQSVYDLKLRAVMCVPLIARDRLVGAIYVDSRAQRKEFTRRDLAFFAALAQQLAISLENARLTHESLERMRLKQEFELAERIQRQLLPEPKGLPEDLEVAQWFEAADAASADTYDVVEGPDGAFSVLLGDVSGHGVGPALIAHSAQSALRSYLELSGDLTGIISRLNDRFEGSVDAGSFISLIVARLERDSGNGARSLRYVNAGHGGAWLVRKEGITELAATGPALGMAAGYPYEEGKEPLDSGDFLFLCSDGLMEARNPKRDLLGEQAVMELLKDCHGQGAEVAVRRVRQLLAEHLQGEACDDDVMLLALAAR
ncbi:MAG: hypothetical protein CSA62_06200 [Planctomycetota bacterium]|nr:MAG: hypothetical protein CSA62_06200 [Planctomycetota bacterium]